MNTSSNLVARAIDIGYGNTKFTLSDGRDGKEIQCKMFPSLAPITGKPDIDKFLDKKDSVVIQMDSGNYYEVGPDAMLAMSSNASRSLDVEFAAKETYMALMRGAMHYMGVDHIDHLVVGLPVSSMEAMANTVKEKMTGVHALPNGKVNVSNVQVVPQPVGGMYDFGTRNQMMANLRKGNNLLIDPGYFTLDWVVTNGTKMVGVRSGAANNAGMGAILRSIMEKIAKSIKERDDRPVEITESVLDRLDTAIRMNEDFIIRGRPHKLHDYLEGKNQVVADALNKLRSKVGTLDDIDRVIIVGGSAHLYEKAVSEMFKGYDVRVSKDSIFSNVRGFQLMASSLAIQAEERMSATA